MFRAVTRRAIGEEVGIFRAMLINKCAVAGGGRQGRCWQFVSIFCSLLFSSSALLFLFSLHFSPLS